MMANTTYHLESATRTRLQPRVRAPATTRAGDDVPPSPQKERHPLAPRRFPYSFFGNFPIHKSELACPVALSQQQSWEYEHDYEA